MASWLVLDWDHEQFHILCAQSARRGIKVSRALSWAHPEPLIAATAERVGKALRDFLKAQKIAAAPVIIGLGRDRIFLKELRIPPIAAHEEASLVRFQTGKEMADAVDNYAVDYTYLSNGDGERHIMTVAARRDIVAICQTLCQAAGLRLHAVTPRLFGAGAALTHALQPEPTPLHKNRLNVVLSVGQRWAELCFFRGQRLLQAQALANGPHLAGEVRRNLAVFRAQHAVDVELDGPDKLYVFASDPAIVKELHLGQPMPLVELNPLVDADETPTNRAAFAGAVGLAEMWSESGKKPVNLSAPKRSQAPTTATQQRFLIYGIAAAVAVILMFGGMIYLNMDRKSQIERLTAYQEAQKDILATTAQERVDLDYYKDWEQTTIPMLDELYDLTARYPFETGFRVNQFAAATVASKKAVKDKYVASIQLRGTNASEKEGDLVNELLLSMARDSHLRSDSKGRKPGADYSMTIDVAKQDIKSYDMKIKVPPRLKAAPAVEAYLEPALTEAERKGAELISAPEENKNGQLDSEEKGDGK